MRFEKDLDGPRAISARGASGGAGCETRETGAVTKHFAVATTLAVCFALIFNDRVKALVTPAAAEESQRSWHLLCNVGLASNSFSFEAIKVQDSAKDTGLENSVALSLELGVYWSLPQRPGTLLGVVFNGGENRSDNGGDELEITPYLLGFSAMRFFAAERKTGFFVRADLGVAAYRVEARGTEHFSDISDLGYGVLVGGGYGISNSRGRSILFNVNYALRRAGADSIGTFA